MLKTLFSKSKEKAHVNMHTLSCKIYQILFCINIIEVPFTVAMLANYLLQTFTSKTYNNLQGVFLTMIGFVTHGHLFFIGDDSTKLQKGD